ncbi:MAG: Uma2 family endonuclease [Cyanobacteria bacterium P01_D01_bin.36]
MYLLDAPPKPIGEKRVVFRDLTWSAFKQVRQLLTERTHALFTYDNGVLEITMPLERHERSARLIERFIWILVGEMGLEMKTMGSTTLDREDLLKSAEPDNGYYIQKFELVADHTIDLSIDPAPDLVVEVDITNTDIQKDVLYASLGVPEFWRFNGRTWKILCLQENQYVEQERSPTFPFVQKSDLYTFLEAALVREMSAETALRKWVREQI